MRVGGTYIVKKILLVEDSPLFRESLASVLRDAYKVLAVESAERALQVLYEEGQRFDLILSDVHLPGITGVEFLRIAKTNNFVGTTTMMLMSIDVPQDEIPLKELGALFVRKGSLCEIETAIAKAFRDSGEP